jgi:catechol 2,3-dioxygenase-like lactoylglutathione lyase family enzyme
VDISTMGTTFTKASIDLGIVVHDLDAALTFYRDVLGLEYQGQNPVPGGGTMHRLLVGSSMVKLLLVDPSPTATSPPGGLRGATGYRYFTLSVANLDGLLNACVAAGRRVVMAAREVAPGARIAIVEDTEGNWVEFLEPA